MITGKQIASDVQGFLDDVLSNGVTPEQAPEVAEGLEQRLCKDLLGDAVFGDITFKDGFYYPTHDPSYNYPADSTRGLILRYLLEHEGETFSKDELYPNIPRQPSSCSSALTYDVFRFVNNNSEVYEAFKEREEGVLKYGIRRIQDAPQDT